MESCEAGDQDLREFEVRLVETRERFDCGFGQSVLEGMARLGRRGIPVGCEGGACGVCKVEVLKGEYQRRFMSSLHISEIDIEEHRVLACRIYPRSDLELKVVAGMKKSLLRHAPAARDNEAG